MGKIGTVIFDADDTLWENELYYKEFEGRFCGLLARSMPAAQASGELFKTEMKNLGVYGYGLKGMMLSMIETACRVLGDAGGMRAAGEIIRLGQELMQKPVELLGGVGEAIPALSKEYRLALATKGDLFDQKRKIAASGLQGFFRHIEIMPEKKKGDYERLFGSLGCAPENVLMVGNSMKSDIIPVLELGGRAVHIPHHITWEHEHFDGEFSHPNFTRLNSIRELPEYLSLV